MRVDKFKGLNTLTDPLEMGLGWLVRAVNVDVIDGGKLCKRDGYSLVSAGDYRSAYSTLDFARTYLAGSSEIQALSGTTLAPLTSDKPVYWCEINKEVYFNNGEDAGIIRPDDAVIPLRWVLPEQATVTVANGQLPVGGYQVCTTRFLPDGRETGASLVAEVDLAEVGGLLITTKPGDNVYIAPADSTTFQFAGVSDGVLVFNTTPDDLGVELTTAFLSPLPVGAGLLQFWQGALYAVEYFPEVAQSVVWVSQPLGFHLFDLARDFFVIPGKVTMLAPHNTALVIGSDAEIYAYNGSELAKVADYGVPAGTHFVIDDNELLFWSHRGLCKALPFVNLTDSHVSLPQGTDAYACLVQQGGQRRYVVVTKNGASAFNTF